MYLVYLLRSLKDGKYYIGQTNDMAKRLAEHNNGYNRSTKYRRPFVLLGYKSFQTRDEARWTEFSIKNHSDKKLKFIQEIIKSFP